MVISEYHFFFVLRLTQLLYWNVNFILSWSTLIIILQCRHQMSLYDEWRSIHGMQGGTAYLYFMGTFKN